jgi:hypothetical protein
MRVTKTKLLRVIAAEERRQKRDERREKRRLQNRCADEPLLADGPWPAPPRTGFPSDGPSTPASHEGSGPPPTSPLRTAPSATSTSPPTGCHAPRPGSCFPSTRKPASGTSASRGRVGAHARSVPPAQAGLTTCPASESIVRLLRWAEAHLLPSAFPLEGPPVTSAVCRRRPHDRSASAARS